MQAARPGVAVAELAVVLLDVAGDHRLLVHDDQSVGLPLFGGVGFLGPLLGRFQFGIEPVTQPPVVGCLVRVGVGLLELVPTAEEGLPQVVEGEDGEVDIGGGTDDIHRCSPTIGHQDRLHVEVRLEQRQDHDVRRVECLRQIDLALVDGEAGAARLAALHAEQCRVDVMAGHQFLRLGQRHFRFVLGGTAGAVGQAQELADFFEDFGFGFHGISVGWG